MQIGMIGLGKMGLNMTRRLLERGHEVIAALRHQFGGHAVRAEE